jgi:Ca2+-transporting ATPase
MSEDQASGGRRPPPEEYRWRKGQSGNPGGRPKGRSVTAAIRELLEHEHNGKPIADLIAEQLLWLNLVTNGIQDVALAFEPGEGSELRRPPRSTGERLLDRVMIQRTLISSTVMGSVGFAAFSWMLRHGWSEEAARNVLLLLMVLFENFHLGNCRSETRSIFTLNPLRTPVLLIGTVTAFLVHVAAMHTPGLAGVLHTGPVEPATWGVLVALAMTVLLADETYKWFSRRIAEVSLSRPLR